MVGLAHEFTHFAEELAETARGMARTSFEKGLDFSSKEDGTPVTETDQSIERVMREMISKRFPGHGILGEEYGSVDEECEFVWVLDPIDGTKSFASGLPTFGSLIALCQNGLPVLGVVELPIMRHRCIGVMGRQTTLNGVPVRTRAKQDIANCVMVTAGVEFFKPPAPAENFYNLMSSTNWNVYGGGCIAYSSLARGAVDICLEGANLSTFDYCAYVPVIQGAGGQITDWRGEALRLVTDPAARAAGIIASGDPRIHNKVLEYLQAE